MLLTKFPNEKVYTVVPGERHNLRPLIKQRLNEGPRASSTDMRKRVAGQGK